MELYVGYTEGTRYGITQFTPHKSVCTAQSIASRLGERIVEHTQRAVLPHRRVIEQIDQHTGRS